LTFEVHDDFRIRCTNRPSLRDASALPQGEWHITAANARIRNRP
jgi:hypothetical protein